MPIVNGYKFLRPLLFSLPPETVHAFTLKTLNWLYQKNFLEKIFTPLHSKPVELMGLKFKNPVGLAAGFDRHGDYFNALGVLGFGFMEIGTVTPLFQSGNPRPRIFRLVQQNALINRMGFYSEGLDYFVENLKKRQYDGVLGVSIVRNKSTPENKVIDDYLTCFTRVYPYADYISVNISSPNTPGLRDMQFGEKLKSLLDALKQEQESQQKIHHKFVPLVIKISPDLTNDEIAEIAQTFLDYQVDGVIATNTSLTRQGVESHRYAQQMGGLSGAPISQRSTDIIKLLRDHLAGEIPIIASGGVMSAQDAVAKIQAGASLIQVYTGLIYQGPELISQILSALNTDQTI